MRIQQLLSKRARPFLRAQEGSNAVEFALALPIFLLLLSGIVEISMVSFVNMLAEGGLREAARFGITGGANDGSSREQQIVNIVAEHTHGLVEASPSSVTMHIYPDFPSIGQAEPFTDGSPLNGEYDPGEDYDDINGSGAWDPDMGMQGAGGPDEIVFYEMTYEWDFLTPLFGLLGREYETITMTATVAVKNEPYGLGNELSGGS